jgi:catechol 2,3-dioxygenase-like lactoylglutathione lyase family enzyme
MTKAKLDQINIVVRDMDAMADFYQRLGVELRAGPPEWAPHHRNNAGSDGIDFDLDSEQFASVWNRGWPGGPGVVLGFHVPDRQSVDRLFDELSAAGYAAQQPPYDAFWGSRYAVVTDPDGNAVGLMSPADDDHRTVPPSPPAG